MSRIEAQRCSCGDTLKGCPFWGPFCALFQDRAPASRRARYELLLEAFRGHFGGGRVLVDSSKSLETVRAWTEVVGRDDVRVLYLVRDVRSWTISMIDLSRRNGEFRIKDLISKFGLGAPRKIAGRSRFNRFRQWYRGNREIDRFLAGSGIPRFQLGYEELCLHPNRLVESLCRFLGVPPTRTMLSIERSGSHIVLGNRMKEDAEKRRGILYDVRWLLRDEWLLPSALLPHVMRYNARQVYRNLRPAPGPPDPDQKIREG